MTEFVALGHAGSGHFAGLESFPNPGVAHVEMTSDELTAVCPITGQPDMYTCTIAYDPAGLCLESKSLKLYLHSFRDHGAFHEDCTVGIGRRLTALLERKPFKVVAVALANKMARAIWAVTAKQQDYQRGYQSSKPLAA